jgi:hypothetical protein
MATDNRGSGKPLSDAEIKQVAGGRDRKEVKPVMRKPGDDLLSEEDLRKMAGGATASRQKRDDSSSKDKRGVVLTDDEARKIAGGAPRPGTIVPDEGETKKRYAALSDDEAAKIAGGGPKPGSAEWEREVGYSATGATAKIDKDEPTRKR